MEGGGIAKLVKTDTTHPKILNPNSIYWTVHRLIWVQVFSTSTCLSLYLLIIIYILISDKSLLVLDGFK